MRHVIVPPARTREEVLDRIDEWHDGGYADLFIDGRESELHEFLGWTKTEYDNYVETGSLPFYLPPRSIAGRSNKPGPVVDETPEAWQTFAVCCVIIVIAVIVILLNSGVL